MRITFGLNVLLVSLLLVSGCRSQRSAGITPIAPASTDWSANPTPTADGLVTNTVDIAAVTNVPADMLTNLVPQLPPATNTVAVAEPLDLPHAKMIVTRDSVTTAMVTLVNPAAKFVVLTFPIGYLPAENQLMSLYRKGLKVGEVKITGPQKDDNVVADLIKGDAQLGDEVR